jgi:hypothetical protein
MHRIRAIRVALLIGVAGTVVLAFTARSHAAPAGTAVLHAANIRPMTAEERTFMSGGLCDLVPANPGSNAATGGPDGAAWTMTTPAPSADCLGSADTGQITVEFPDVECGDTSGITALGLEVVMLGGQSVLGADLFVFVLAPDGSPAAGSAAPVDAPAAGGTVELPVFAPDTSPGVELLDSGNVAQLHVNRKSGDRTLSIDAISLVVQGDVSTCTTFDRDGDGLTEAEEVQYGTDPLSADTDGDGLGDADEVRTLGTDPTQADTDGGGVDDGTEVGRGTNRLDPSDDLLPAADELPATGSSTHVALVGAWIALGLGALLSFVGRERPMARRP